MKIIDVFNHIFPARCFEKFLAIAPHLEDMGKRDRNVPMLVDLDTRFRVMDEFGDYCQILSLASPPIESYAGPELSPLIARMANDEMAELVERYPDRFPGFVASLPMNNPEAAAGELDRAINELGARGAQIYTNVAGKPLDAREFAPLFDALAACDLPVWLHPARDANHADYPVEDKSKYEIWWTFGWPYETSVAMARLVFAGMFERHPGIKIITHHMGGMIPYFEGRVGHGWDQLGARTSDQDYAALLGPMKKRLVDYFHMFYADTALFGALPATRCGLEFFGADRIVFASDSPFEPQPGLFIRETIRVVNSLEVSREAREKILHGNILRLLHSRPGRKPM